MDLRNFDFFLIFKIDTKIHNQKINFLFFISNYLFRNLQKICKIVKLKLKPKLKPLSIFGC